jgi:DNA-binding winged helix-turn-helix (wHTH) protein/tetratricopeptide (TPR) repeat protein
MPVRFGDFELSPETYELRHRGVRVHLEPRVLEVLAYLVAHRGRVVPKEELIAQLWEGSHVTDSALSRVVRDARRALGDSGLRDGWIQTVHGRGFRFAAGEAASPAAATPDPAPPPPRGEPAQPSHPVVAVLRFEGAGHADADYLAEGIPESLVHALSRVDRLRVLPRQATFRLAPDTDIAGAAAAVGATHVVSGRVLLRGDTLVVRAELADATQPALVWGGEVRRQLADLFEVQEAIVAELFEALRLRLTPDERHRLARRPTTNQEAYRLYLEGRYHWHQRGESGVRRGLACFEAARDADPSFALAEVGVADAYNILGFYEWMAPREAFPRAHVAARRALAVAPELPEAHATLAYVLTYFDWDLDAAEAHLARALTLDARCLPAHHYGYNLMTAAGRFDEAIARSDRAIELAPLWVLLHAARGWIHYYARRWDDALAAFDVASGMDSRYALNQLWRGWALAAMGRGEEAIAELSAVAGDGPQIEVRGSLAHALARAGRADEARVLRSELVAGRATAYVSSYHLAVVDLALGDVEGALAGLDTALEERSHMLVFLDHEPKLDPLRGEPRFADLRRRLGIRDLR